MIDRIDFYYPYSNSVVTNTYFSILFSAFEHCGIECNIISSLNEKTCDTILVSAAQDATRAKGRGYTTVIIWIQGIIPEESYMRNHSRLKRKVLSFIEKRGLKNSDIVFYVSSAMKDHFKAKYGYDNKRYYIMPCFNEELHEEAFYAKEKYKNNVFLYAGSLDAWQCFIETAALYASIEKTVKNCSFRVLTKDRNTATRIIKEQGIQNYTVDYVPADKIGVEMEKAKFGFSIRLDDPVNRVATPTKLSTYIAYGVIPIYSKCLHGFDETAHDNQFCICLDRDENSMQRLIDMCYTEIKPEEVYKQMKESFGKYYSSSYHVEHITEVLREWLP